MVVDSVNMRYNFLWYMKQNPTCNFPGVFTTHWWNDNIRLLCCPLQWLPRRSNIGSGPRPIHEIRQEMYQEQQPRKAHSGPPAPLSLPSQQPFRSRLSSFYSLSLFCSSLLFLFPSSPPSSSSSSSSPSSSSSSSPSSSPSSSSSSSSSPSSSSSSSSSSPSSSLPLLLLLLFLHFLSVSSL